VPQKENKMGSVESTNGLHIRRFTNPTTRYVLTNFDTNGNGDVTKEELATSSMNLTTLENLDQEVTADQLRSQLSRLGITEQRDPMQKFSAVSQSYQAFDPDNLSSLQRQLDNYDNEWISQLPPEQKAEALRQWAWCLWVELTARRMAEHHISGFMADRLALTSPETNAEYYENKAIFDDILSKIKLAQETGNDTTKEKAGKLAADVNEILGKMRLPEIKPKEIRGVFPLQSYLKIEIQHPKWPAVDNIKISLTSDEEMALTQAGQNGYSLVTDGDFDPRAGGNLILYKDNSPVNPPQRYYVPGLTLTIIGFAIE
jgi:hypothetical protein